MFVRILFSTDMEMADFCIFNCIAILLKGDKHNTKVFNLLSHDSIAAEDEESEGARQPEDSQQRDHQKV